MCTGSMQFLKCQNKALFLNVGGVDETSMSNPCRKHNISF